MFVTREGVRTIYVAVTQLPLVLRNILETAIAAQPDMQVADRSLHDIDVLITGIEREGVPAELRRLLGEWPAAPVFGISKDGLTTTLFHRDATERSLGNISLDGLLSAVRAAVRFGR